MIFSHDPRDSFFRDPPSAVTVGREVTLTVCVSDFTGRGCESECGGGGGGFEPAEGDIALRLVRKFRDEVDELDLSPAEICFDPENDRIVLRFVVGGDVLARPGVYFYSVKAGDEESPELGRITVTDRKSKVPDWFKDTVIYQIFPDRFAVGEDSRVVLKHNSFMYATRDDRPLYVKDDTGEVIRWDFFGGNLKGVLDRIGYIKRLGAGTVYLNPIFESVSNHRYDTGDYEHVDGLLGGDGAFRDLASGLSENGMRLILDGVFSHTGRESRYFRAAKAGVEPYVNWYIIRDDGTYECWWDVDDLPCVNETEPSYFDYTVKGPDSIVRRWLRAGASGWRLDVADELPDEYIEAIREAASEARPDSVIIGEVWEDGTDKTSYGVHRSYYTKAELDSQTNYPFRKRLLDFFSGKAGSDEISGMFSMDTVNYPRDIYYSLVNMTGSHDVPRLFSCLKEIARGSGALAKGLLKAYSLIQFAFPGVPLIYYGDETCMEGGPDPDNRRFFTEKSDSVDIVSWFSELAAMRRDEAVFRSGGIRFIDTGDVNVFAFCRFDGGREMICAVDRFGRGPGFIAGTVEKSAGMKYNVKKQADGYGLLLEKAAGN
jgi:glycosidase